MTLPPSQEASLFQITIPAAVVLGGVLLIVRDLSTSIPDSPLLALLADPESK